MPFPLKLTAFERYMWADDRPASPMSAFFRVSFSGKLDAAALGAGIEAALRRHPLLHARIAGDRERDLVWVASPELLPWMDFAGESVPMRFPRSSQINLREENGLRVWVRSGEGRGEIRFQLHHACSDAIGMNQFIEDMLCAYDRLCRGVAGAEAGRPLDFDGLRQRHCFGAGWRNRLLQGLAGVWGAVAGPFLFFLVRPVPPQAPERTGASGVGHDDGAVPELPAWRSTPAQLDRLLAVAKRSGATLNDLMIRDFFLAIQTWNQTHSGTARQVLRIMVPFNLRGPAHAGLSAANVMGMINLDRRFNGLWRWTAPRLLRSIRWETRLLKVTRLAAGFATAMAAAGAVRGGLRKALETDRCITTAVVSNVGRLFEETPLGRRDGKLLAGGLMVEAVDAAPPARRGSGISCMLSTYGGRLSLAMQYDRRAYSAAIARELLGCITARIEETAHPAPAAIV